jgi:hypothetical protein
MQQCITLYVLGGGNGVGRYLKECERYVSTESRWEVLPALPVGCLAMSAVELDYSLYALGGWANRDLGTVQKLSLDSLTWELIQVQLPQAVYYFPCFKTDTQVYLLIEKTLYSFTPLRIKPIKTVHEGIEWCDTSYYSRGNLHYSWRSEVGSVDIGELASHS